MVKFKKDTVITLLIFWPWIIIFLEFVVLIIAKTFGCSISARGPSPCHFLGLVDIGEYLYPLWSIGYQIAFSLFWVLPALGFWLFALIVFKISGAKD